MTGESFTIRLATTEDIPVIMDIHQRSWLFAYKHCLPLQLIQNHTANRYNMWKELLAKNDDEQYVAVFNGKIIGFLGVIAPRDVDLFKDTRELQGLYLDPDYVGRGFGTRIINWVKNSTLSMGCTRISLWVLAQNIRAKNFYRKNGFCPDGSVKLSGLNDTIQERYIWCAAKT